ncbi:MAG: FGGY family pentulose kinase [Rhizobiales bacterium]|nr:FGGY family pentulose kinase [Hyphomicrobiales bacterium]
MPPAVCAVDVGTGSARAAVFASGGDLLGYAETPVAMHQPAPGWAEHDSEQIWRAVVSSVRAATTASAVPAEEIAAIAFDATCSLVVRGAAGARLPMAEDASASWDTIAWLDHRALEEADEITATRHPALEQVGGTMSPEMQLPKLLWLKRRRPDIWSRAGYIGDLADFLAFRACGSATRSLSTLTTKWGYAPDRDSAWPDDLLAALGLSDLLERAGIASPPAAVATALGTLGMEAAGAMGLAAACKVGAGLVDAYAGALGVLGGLPASELDRSAALIAGTSSCVMHAAAVPRPRRAVWGPYRDAALQGLWMSEAGQSASGALLDHVVRLHGLGPSAATHARIAERVRALRAAEGDDFASRLHVLPDFHGNRAPFGDPHALGVVHGLPLDSSFDALCRLYWRACGGVALGIRQIVDALRADGCALDALHIAGGHQKNPLLMELYADALDCRIVEPRAREPVLLGTAMVAAVAGGIHPDLPAAARAMTRPGRTRTPDRAAKAAYDRDYAVFLELHRQRAAIDALIRRG